MQERRLSPRVATRVAVNCRAPATPLSVVVCDISLHGCRIETQRSLVEPGSTVLIDLTEQVRVIGTVAWVDGHYAGIRFNQELDLVRLGTDDWLNAVGQDVPLHYIDQAA